MVNIARGATIPIGRYQWYDLIHSKWCDPSQNCPGSQSSGFRVHLHVQLPLDLNFDPPLGSAHQHAPSKGLPSAWGTHFSGISPSMSSSFEQYRKYLPCRPGSHDKNINLHYTSQEYKSILRFPKNLAFHH